jgi:hypothetical protein
MNVSGRCATEPLSKGAGVDLRYAASPARLAKNICLLINSIKAIDGAALALSAYGIHGIALGDPSGPPVGSPSVMAAFLDAHCSSPAFGLWFDFGAGLRAVRTRLAAAAPMARRKASRISDRDISKSIPQSGRAAAQSSFCDIAMNRVAIWPKGQ